MKEGIKKIYSNRNDFLLVGLTGRTGSGCTTASSILRQKIGDFTFPDITSLNLKNPNEIRKNNIVLKFSKKNWEHFYIIQVKDIITAYILEYNFDDFKKYLDSTGLKASLDEKFDSIKEEYESLHKTRIQLKQKEGIDELPEKIKIAYEFHFTKLQVFADKLKKLLKEDYTPLYQKLANNIRSTGQAIPKNDDFNINEADSIVKKVNKLIKLLRVVAKDHNRPAFIVIDALRNPFEIHFLQARYSAFYLISINTSEEERKRRLITLNYNENAMDALDAQEYPKKLIGKDLYISQNIQSCIELADIHIHNPKSLNDNYNELKTQLIWYYSLMIKPGLVPPTPIERVMQIAYTAKLNSGCISRQVGAAITDSDFSIKSIGWNNTPQNQVPCILRNSQDLISSSDQPAFSEYELTDKKFRKTFKEIFTKKEVIEHDSCGHNISFCFKDIQNSLEKEKNQVHTRSLHAEENAFLQLTKYGSTGIIDGILFTTASPCELCSKKAYQLGIKKIFYIDPYPGIATTHILKGGTLNPELLLYRGVVGSAYFNLYHPFLSYKDEINQITGLNFSYKTAQNELEKRNKELEKKNKELEDKLLKLEKSAQND